jgi:cell wall-associated NlpC family hydrolase
MEYNPKPGDYGVVRSNGWAAKLIQIGTISRWNHAFIYIGDKKVIEARPTGVTITPLSEYTKVAWNQHEEIDNDTRGKIVAAAHHFVGQPYGFLDIINILFRIIGLKALANTKIFEKLAMNHGLICSELVSLAYRDAGIDLTGMPDHRVTPGDLAERLIYQ